MKEISEAGVKLLKTLLETELTAYEATKQFEKEELLQEVKALGDQGLITVRDSDQLPTLVISPQGVLFLAQREDWSTELQKVVGSDEK